VKALAGYRSAPLRSDSAREEPMADSSFDIVSKIDRQEVDNALNQAAKEIAQRYDFKNTDASIEWQGELGIRMKANSEERVKAVLDVFQSKLVKRGVSLKALKSGDPKASGKDYLVEATLEQGIAQEQAKKIGKMIRDEGPKGVRAQIQGDELRVTSKSRDDLQSVIAMLNAADLDVALQFVNYR
jgi:cyclic-di-GMP-binding protein